MPATDLGESGAGVGGGALVKGLSQHLLGEDGVAVVLLAVGGDVVGGVDALAVGRSGELDPAARGLDLLVGDLLARQVDE